MTQYQLTLDPTVLQRLFTSSDGQLAHLLEAILNQVLEAQMAEQLQAQHYERTEERQGYRNGYQPRQLTTPPPVSADSPCACRKRATAPSPLILLH